MFVPPTILDSAPMSPAATQQLPESPRLSVIVPFATIVYSSAGMHLTYTMLLRDEANDLTWQCARRYSAYRAPHASLGKQHVSSGQFPSVLLTARGNRSKAEIELRREKLEQYMQRLIDAIFNTPMQSIQFQRVVRLLRFVEYPFLSDWEGHARLGVEASDGNSAISETVQSVHFGRITALEPTRVTPPPTIVSTRWRPPHVLPGPRLGLAMPFITLAQDVEGTWDVVVKGDKQVRKGLLRHRYDEAAAICAHIASDSHVMDASEAQDFIIEFRRKHPLAAYLRYEKALEITSPTSASRSDRSSGLSDASAPRSLDEAVEVGSPHVHHHRFSAADGDRSTKPSQPPVHDRGGAAARPPVVVEPQQLFSSQRAVDAARRPRNTCEHHNLLLTYDDVPTAIIFDEAHVEAGSSSHWDPTQSVDSPTTAANVPDSSCNAAASGVERYVGRVRGERVAGCRCTTQLFCTSPGFGDVYATASGWTVIVCPPKNAPFSANDDD